MRMKIAFGFSLVIFILALFTMPVIADLQTPTIPWQPNMAVYQGYGWFTSYTGPYYEGDYPSKGDTCIFQISGSKIRNTWSGRGVWFDQSWGEGPLTAILSINNGLLQHDTNPGHITEIFVLFGNAKVYVGGLYKGTYVLEFVLADSATVNLIDGQVPDPMWNVDWLHVSLTDQMTKSVYYESAGRLGGVWPGGGNIRTWWYPTYPGM